MFTADELQLMEFGTHKLIDEKEKKLGRNYYSDPESERKELKTLKRILDKIPNYLPIEWSDKDEPPSEFNDEVLFAWVVHEGQLLFGMLEYYPPNEEWFFKYIHDGLEYDYTHYMLASTAQSNLPPIPQPSKPKK